MKKQLVFTVLSKDQPGIVSQLAEVVNTHGASWMDSRMSQLAGQFAGVILVEAEAEKIKGLEKELSDLSKKSNISVHFSESTDNAIEDNKKLHQIELVGPDRPGIVREVSKLFQEKDINILELDTEIADASMSGGVLFTANAVISVKLDVNLDDLNDRLKELADELTLDIEWTKHI